MPAVYTCAPTLVHFGKHQKVMSKHEQKQKRKRRLGVRHPREPSVVDVFSGMLLHDSGLLGLHPRRNPVEDKVPEADDFSRERGQCKGKKKIHIYTIRWAYLGRFVRRGPVLSGAVRFGSIFSGGG